MFLVVVVEILVECLLCLLGTVCLKKGLECVENLKLLAVEDFLKDNARVQLILQQWLYIVCQTLRVNALICFTD